MKYKNKHDKALYISIFEHNKMKKHKVGKNFIMGTFKINSYH